MTKEATPTPLHTQLLDGLNVKSRADGSVHTVKAADGKTVAEVCVGTKKIRANFRTAPKGAVAKLLDGKSKSWPAGGVVVDGGNAERIRAALLQIAA